MRKAPSSQSKSLSLALSEREILKVVLEFLETRGLHISQLSLERETGVINGDFSDDVIFLRQLIVDGQWDNVIDFVQPLRSCPEFDFTAFRYNITKYKFFELLCVKLEPGPLQDNDFAVEELVECLKDLEHICPSPEDYRQLCALLTLPKLSDHADFKHWNPSAARIECFRKVEKMVGSLLPPSGKEKERRESHAEHDRLLGLLVKGLFYEGCVDYCQTQAVGDTSGQSGPVTSSLLSVRPRLSSTDLSLVSWLEMVTPEQFAMPFQQKQLELKVEQLRKPKLEAPWTETILATPVKPRDTFPHDMVPKSKMKFAEKMSQSMIPTMALSMQTSVFPTPSRSHPMSQSTAAGFCLGIKDAGTDAMQQSQLIDALMETSQLAKCSRPVDLLPQNQAINNNQNLAPQVMAPAMAHSMMGGAYDFTPVRRQLDEMTRRSLPPTQRQPSLPPVPELTTPPQDELMTQSRLFQEFNSRQKPMQMYRPAAPQPPQPQPQPLPPPAPMVYLPNGQMLPAPAPVNVSMGGRPQSMVFPPGNLSPHHNPRPTSMPPNGLGVQFVPVVRYEDAQAIRAVAFHPTGRFFAVGTNSKQMNICLYPDLRNQGTNEGTRSAEILLSRPKQHRGSVYCLSFNPTGELLVTGSNDKTLRLMGFNADQCKIEKYVKRNSGAEMELTFHDGTIRDVVFLEDSVNRTSVVVSGGAGNCHLHITDCHSGQMIQSMKGHNAPILGLYTWGSASFVSCSQDKTIRFWDIRTPQAVNVIQPQHNKSHNAPVTSVCVDPSGSLLVSGHEDASVTLFDINGNRVLQSFRPHGDEVRTVRLSNAAYYLLSASYDRRVVITDMRGDLMAPLTYLPVAEHSDKIIQCRWHPFDFSFISTSADRTAVLWALPPPSRF